MRTTVFAVAGLALGTSAWAAPLATGSAPSGYRGQLERWDNSNTFSCFQNEFNFKGQWQCNLGQGHRGDTQYLKK